MRFLFLVGILSTNVTTNDEGEKESLLDTLIFRRIGQMYTEDTVYRLMTYENWFEIKYIKFEVHKIACNNEVAPRPVKFTKMRNGTVTVEHDDCSYRLISWCERYNNNKIKKVTIMYGNVTCDVIFICHVEDGYFHIATHLADPPIATTYASPKLPFYDTFKKRIRGYLLALAVFSLILPYLFFMFLKWRDTGSRYAREYFVICHDWMKIKIEWIMEWIY